MAKRKKIAPETTDLPPPEPVLVDVPAAEEKIEPKPTEDSIITDQYIQLAEQCRQLPDIHLVPTDRWYGETFYPAYSRVLNAIRALLE
jgi:hypothetical protein